MIDLPPELAALINAERAAKVASAAERVVVRAKLAASVGAAPLGSAAVGATLAGTGKAFAIVAITLAAGGGAALALRDDAPSMRAPIHAVASSTRGVRDVVPPPDENETMTVVMPDPVLAPAPVARPFADLPSERRRGESGRVAIKAPASVHAPATVVAAPVADLASERPLNESAPAVVATPSATTPRLVAPVPPAQRDDSAPPTLSPTSPPQRDPVFAPNAVGVAAPAVPSQVEIVRAAWAALSAGNATRALALADEDSRARMGGALVEERDAVRIVALAKLSRRADAQRAANRFLALYPTSVHRALIQRALADEELQ